MTGPEIGRRELLEETVLAGPLTLLDVYSGADFVVSYPDGYRAFVVGATFETCQTEGALRLDEDGETLELAWFVPGRWPTGVNAYDASLLRGVGLLG